MRRSERSASGCSNNKRNGTHAILRVSSLSLLHFFPLYAHWCVAFNELLDAARTSKPNALEPAEGETELRSSEPTPQTAELTQQQIAAVRSSSLSDDSSKTEETGYVASPTDHSSKTEATGYVARPTKHIYASAAAVDAVVAPSAAVAAAPARKGPLIEVIDSDDEEDV